MSKYATDEQRLQELSTGDSAQWRLLYEELRSPFRLYFLKYSRQSPEVISELYQDAMVVLHRKITSGGLQAPLASSLKTYLFGVGKMLFRKRLDTKTTWDDEIPEVAIPAAVEDKIVVEEQAAWIRAILSKMGEKCREILEKVYLHGFSMEAIAEEMNLSNAGAARKRKFDCLKRARQLIN
jgi:RNA polymerase sigma factor (sigma-70 family)